MLRGDSNAPSGRPRALSVHEKRSEGRSLRLRCLHRHSKAAEWITRSWRPQPQARFCRRRAKRIPAPKAFFRSPSNEAGSSSTMALYESRMSSPPSPPTRHRKAPAMPQAEDAELAEDLAASRFENLQPTAGAAGSRAAAPGGRRRERGPSRWPQTEAIFSACWHACGGDGVRGR